MSIEVHCPTCDILLAIIKLSDDINDYEVQHIKDAYGCSTCLTSQEE